MTASISEISEAVLNEVKSAKLVKLAELEIVKNPTTPSARTEIGQLLQKLAGELRSQTDDVTVGDVKSFLDGVMNAG